MGFPGGTVVKDLPAKAAWSRKIPHAVEQQAHAPQLLSLRSRAHEPQLLSPRATTTEAGAPGAGAPQQEKPRQ